MNFNDDYYHYFQAEEAAAAEVYAEYIESFQNSAAVGKAFVRGSVVNPDQESRFYYQSIQYRLHQNQVFLEVSLIKLLRFYVRNAKNIQVEQN